MAVGIRRQWWFAILSLYLAAPAPAFAQVRPGDRITRANASKVRNLVSPGVYLAVTKGMVVDIVPAERIEWPPPYMEATEKYSPQVRLSADHRSLVGYVAGQPFPLLDPNDPDVATKIMWNTNFRPINTDDFDLRFFDCEVEYFNPGGRQRLLYDSELGHFAGYSNIGRTEVEPMPLDPDMRATGIWWRFSAYPVMMPAEVKGSGAIRYRYWDADRADDSWTYTSFTRRLRRVNETYLSSSTGLSTWDPDHQGGFAAKPQEYNYRFLGERELLACANAIHSPAQRCESDGGATSCPENWQMRRVYLVEVTPRPERIAALQSRTVVYVDGEMWFNPYVDSYDQRGDLWKTQIYYLTWRDRPVPQARVAIYPFKRQFVLAAVSIDVQSGLSTACYLPGHHPPERDCWYINMGAVHRDFFRVETMVSAGH